MTRGVSVLCDVRVPRCVNQEELTVGAPQWWRSAPDPGSLCFTAGTMIGTPVRLTENPSFVVASAQHVSGTPHARRLAVCALECAAEGFLGIVANPAGDDADAEIGRGQQVLC
jgi:hypothetical protein